MEFVETEEQIALNVLTFNSYSKSTSGNERKFYGERLRRGYQLVCFRHEGEVLFCPSRFVGYISNTRVKHIAFEGKHGTETTARINSILGRHEVNGDMEEIFLVRCREFDLKPFDRNRGYWVLSDAHTKLVLAQPTSGPFGFPDEVANDRTFVEGGVQRVLVNRYERDPKARKACLDHYGTKCRVCHTRMNDFYGKIAEDFIHVHHLKPQTLRQPGYEVDPINDLIPVCPNCHAMLHLSDPPFTPEELQELISDSLSSQED
jgi:5-methylcytosine-specific restriction protein A